MRTLFQNRPLLTVMLTLALPGLMGTACTRAEDASKEPAVSAENSKPAADRSGSQGETSEGAPAGRDDGPGSIFDERPASPLTAIVLPPEPPATVALEDARPTIDALFDEASRLRSEIKRESFDIDTVLARTGPNLESIFRWVRKKTRPLPYRGVLKGAQGTLMDRGGNSLDRSLLLAELLQRSGYEVELANAQLTERGREAIEEQVLDRLGREHDPSEVAAQGAGLDSEVERLATIVGQNPTESLAWVSEVQRQAAVVRTDLLAQADRQSKALMASVELEKGGESGLQMALEALEDHWWVVVSDASRVLDLHFDQADGDLLEQGLAGAGALHAIDALPGSLFHTVTLSVVADQSSGQTVRSREALSKVFRVAELGLQPIGVGFVPSWAKESPIDLGDLATSRARLHQTLEEETGWTPVLSLGDEVFIDSTIAPDGSIGSAQALFGTGQALGSALGQLQGLGDPGASSSGGMRLVGVALKVVLSSPLGDQSFVRSLFGGGGDGQSVRSIAERNARFLSQQSFVVQTSRVPNAFLAEMGFAEIVDMRSDFRRLIAAAEVGNEEEVLEATLAIRPPVEATQQLAALRFGQGASEVASVLVSANILSSFQSVSLVRDSTVVSAGMDILENRILPLALEASVARRASVYQGVLDTLLEDALLGIAEERTNTALFFGRDLDATEDDLRGWQAVGASEGRHLYPAAAHAIASTAGRDDLRVVYAPDRWAADGGAAPFWRIDTETGATLGLGSDGRGSVYAEALIMMNLGWTLFNGYKVAEACDGALGSGDACRVRACVYRSVTLGLGVVGGGIAGVAFGVSGKALAAAGLLYKKLTFVTGAVLSGTCESG